MSNYGPKLTEQEYNTLVLQNVRLGLSSTDVEKIEFDLIIDYRLGQDFPVAQRKKLFQLHTRLKRFHPLMMLWGVIKSPSDILGYVGECHVKLFGKFLSQEDLTIFFDLDNTDQHPV